MLETIFAYLLFLPIPTPNKAKNQFCWGESGTLKGFICECSAGADGRKWGERYCFK